MAALNNIDAIEEFNNKMKIFFSKELYYDTVVKNIDLVKNECKKIVGRDYIIEPVYDPNKKKEKKATITDINISRIKEIFDGKEFL